MYVYMYVLFVAKTSKEDQQVFALGHSVDGKRFNRIIRERVKFHTQKSKK